MNKEDYEKLTDGELSLAILKIKVGMADYYRISKTNSTARCNLGTDGCGSCVLSFDINDWADMGPLIESIWTELHEWERDTEDTESDRSIESCSGNKLRAAAIVYLMMQGMSDDF